MLQQEQDSSKGAEQGGGAGAGRVVVSAVDGSGHPMSYECDYLLAADGAHSLIR